MSRNIEVIVPPIYETQITGYIGTLKITNRSTVYEARYERGHTYCKRDGVAITTPPESICKAFNKAARNMGFVA